MGTGQSTSEEIMAKVFANSEHSQEELDEEIPDDAWGTEEHVSKERELVKEYAWPEGIYEQPELGHVVAEKSAEETSRWKFRVKLANRQEKLVDLGKVQTLKVWDKKEGYARCKEKVVASSV